MTTNNLETIRGAAACVLAERAEHDAEACPLPEDAPIPYVVTNQGRAALRAVKKPMASAKPRSTRTI